MGQKVNPVSFRIGINKTWDSSWITNKKSYADMLHKDLALRDFMNKEFKGLSVDKINISSSGKDFNITINTAKPGILIGRKGERLEELKNKLESLSGTSVKLSIKDVKKPDLSARIMAEEIQLQLEKRGSYKKALQFASSKIMEAGAVGAKVQVSGRLGGADMKRKEYIINGRVPFQTISADIDYAYVRALTQTGIVSVKVWIFKGIKSKKESNVRAKEN
ncbi:MAG: 30S ribosomal protein S3 [Patescibacteria group bacterium]